jgi:hypothetical protein
MMDYLKDKLAKQVAYLESQEQEKKDIVDGYRPVIKDIKKRISAFSKAIELGSLDPIYSKLGADEAEQVKMDIAAYSVKKTFTEISFEKSS